MSNIGAFIQAYQDKHGSSDRALALRVGVTPTLIGKWKHGRFVELPKPELIEALAQQLGVKYDLLLDAFLADTGYREDVMGNAEHPAPIAARKIPDLVIVEKQSVAHGIDVKSVEATMIYSRRLGEADRTAVAQVFSRTGRSLRPDVEDEVVRRAQAILDAVSRDSGPLDLEINFQQTDDSALTLVGVSASDGVGDDLALSARTSTVGDLIAADEQDRSISGEQEESDTP